MWTSFLRKFSASSSELSIVPSEVNFRRASPQLIFFLCLFTAFMMPVCSLFDMRPFTKSDLRPIGFLDSWLFYTANPLQGLPCYRKSKLSFLLPKEGLKVSYDLEFEQRIAFLTILLKSYSDSGWINPFFFTSWRATLTTLFDCCCDLQFLVRFGYSSGSISSFSCIIMSGVSLIIVRLFRSFFCVSSILSYVSECGTASYPTSIILFKGVRYGK